ncbi:type II toxin-antitoxin system RelE/ParE family toxin [Azospirillum sp.]|uniref:type II toxin-antitoxin system RelE/ParE family toxin n=1 Tax=Azospirillum sp. TaxID=34012 RepID=UPI002D670C15|nr:type II toxin-antitoxin system RelE/ParE family toxin [Azospirillum sp.]HYD66424.1 type II toxin-antitoxin system RelE/ParE family toxin [Azospirillum sp.]
MRVQWTIAALRSAAVLFLWIRERDPLAAERVYDAIIRTGNSLATMVRRHRPRANGRRRIPVAGYEQFYIRYRISLEDGEEIVVLETVRRGAGDRRTT